MNWTQAKRRLQVPTKRYRIGELVRFSPFSRQTIHNYTIMGLIREAEWTEGGHRLYDESVFARLSRILELRETMSLTEVRRVLNQEEARDSTHPLRSTALPPEARAVSPQDGHERYAQGDEGLADAT
ncbi:MAG: MerR family transcriptional regulator [Sedimentisphaerales bacterium]|nr:MerR family transcriptional regulator [Sedimentisphaerales bacterium]